MDGWVALLSVTFTGLVGIGGLLVTFAASGAQRRHEAGLAHTARVWEQKSDALLGVITVARRLIDTLDAATEAQRESFGVNLDDEVRRLDDLVAVMEAHAADASRRAFHDLRSLLAAAKRDVAAASALAVIRREKEEAYEAVDFDSAVVLRQKERAALKRLNEVHGLDPDEVRKQARRAIEAARDDLRQ